MTLVKVVSFEEYKRRMEEAASAQTEDDGPRVVNGFDPGSLLNHAMWAAAVMDDLELAEDLLDVIRETVIQKYQWAELPDELFAKVEPIARELRTAEAFMRLRNALADGLD